MKTCRLSVTDIDSFAWYKKIESMTADDMVDRLLRKAEQNEQMKIGQVFHDIMDNPPNEIDAISRNGFTFLFECESTIIIPQVREIKTEKEYIVDGIRVVLVGKCDGVTANQIDDHKITFKPNPETYLDSFQWRAYLDMFGANKFRYLIYSARKKGHKSTPLIEIYDISELTMYRYQNMQNDLICGISDLLNFIKEYAPKMIKNG